MTLLSRLAALTLTFAPVVAFAQERAPGDNTSRLDTVRVRETRSRGYAAPVTRSATRMPERPLNIPQSLTIMSRGQLDDQAMRSMADVVRYLPAMTMGQGEGHRDQPTTRGISSTADLYIDGVRDDAQYLRDVYNVERIEALRGPNALAFGRGGGGGVLNRVMRQADFATHSTLVAERGAFDQSRGTLDAGRSLGTRTAVRLNAVAEQASSFRGVALDRAGANPTAALVLAGGLLRMNAERFEDRRTVDRGLPSFHGAPSLLPQSTFLGSREVNRARATVTHSRLEYERGDEAAVQLRSVLAWSHYDKMYQNIVPGALDATATTVTLTAYRNATDRQNLFSQTDLSWAMRGAASEHRVLVGMEFGRQFTTNFRETGYFANSATSVSVPARGDGVVPEVAWRQSLSDADNGMEALIAATHVQHQARVGRWQTTLGVRVERMALHFDNHRSGATLGRTDVLVSPRAGLVFKPRPTTSLYLSLATSALPSAGDQFSSLTATTRTLQPELFETREAGAKWEPTPRLRLSGAWFTLTRSRASAPDPVRPGVVVQTGAQHSRGVELEAQGEVRSGWQMSGTFTAQRARITNRTTSGLAGATIPLVPAQSLTLWNRVALGARMSAGLGVVHQTRMYAAIDNAVTLPSFTRVDAALYVPIHARLMMQAHVENVVNTRYVATANNNNNLQPGAPRMVRVSMTVR